MRTPSINQNHEFRRLYYRGKSSSGKFCSVYCLKNRYGITRLGITVGGKVGNAVMRNLVRRRISESFRLMYAGLRGGFDIVIVARGSATAATYRQLDRELKYHMDKLGLSSQQAAQPPKQV